MSKANAVLKTSHPLQHFTNLLYINSPQVLSRSINPAVSNKNVVITEPVKQRLWQRNQLMFWINDPSLANGGVTTRVHSPLPFPLPRDPNNQPKWCSDSLALLPIQSTTFGIHDVREIKHNFGDDIPEHSVCRCDPHLPLACHLKSQSYFWPVRSLLHSCKEHQRKLDEQHLIFPLVTWQPYRMNIEFSNFR